MSASDTLPAALAARPPGPAPGPDARDADWAAQGGRVQGWLAQPLQAPAAALQALREQLAAAPPHAGDPAARVELLLALQQLHHLRTETAAGLALAAQAVALARTLVAPPAVSPLLRRALTFQGVMRMEAGNHPEALASLSEALVVAEALGDAAAQAPVWSNLGLVLRSLSRFDEATACFARALQLAPETGPYSVVIRPALSNLADCALHLGELDRGLRAVRRALALNAAPASATEVLSRAIAESNCVRLLLARGDLDLAAEHLREVLHWAGRHPSPRARLLAGFTEGLHRVHAGDAEAGLQRVCAALEQARRELPAELHDLLEGAIAAYRLAGQPDVALVYLHELQALHRDTRATRVLEQHAAHLQRLDEAAAGGAAARQRSLAARQAALRQELGGRELLCNRLQMLEQQCVAAELHDDATGRHCYRVGRLASLLGRAIGLEDEVCFLIDLAARLHDIGKLTVADAILLKPGRLDPDERLLMQGHAAAGAEILARSRIPQMHVAEAIARHHHERWDGSGYPDRLRGPAIPIAARVAALADVFDALTHRRPYKHAWTVDEALAEIRSLRGRQFDPELTDVFLELVPRLQREAGDLDAYLGVEALQSPFIQARDRVALALAGGVGG